MTCLQGKKVREERGAAASFCGPCRRSGAREAGSVSPGTLLGPGSRQRGRVPPRSIPAAAAASRFCIPQVGARELPPRCPTARAGGGGGGVIVCPGARAPFSGARPSEAAEQRVRVWVSEGKPAAHSQGGWADGVGREPPLPASAGESAPTPHAPGGVRPRRAPGRGGVSCRLGPGLRLGALNGPRWPADDDTAP